MNRNIVMAVVLSCLTLTAHAQEPEQWPDWLAQAMAAETKKLKSKKHKLGDTGIAIRLAGKTIDKPRLTEDDGDWYMSSNIGGDAQMECFVSPDRLNLAATAAALADLSIENVTGQGLGPLAARRIYHLDAGALDKAPYVALEWFYTVGEAPKQRAGMAKVRVAQRDGWAFFCLHNTLGYRDTFAAAFSKLVLEVAGSAPESPPYFEEILVQKIDGRRLGFARTAFRLDDEGDTYTELQSAMLVPVDGSKLSTVDTFDYDWSTPDGVLINAAASSTTDGNPDLDLTLNHVDGTWIVQGMLQGKELKQALGSDIEPASAPYQYRTVRDIMTSSSADEASFHMWVPSVSPTEFAPVVVRTTPGQREAGRAVLTFGPLEVPVVVDDDGLVAETRIDIGGTELMLERAWLHGSID